MFKAVVVFVSCCDTTETKLPTTASALSSHTERMHTFANNANLQKWVASSLMGLVLFIGGIEGCFVEVPEGP